MTQPSDVPPPPPPSGGDQPRRRLVKVGITISVIGAALAGGVLIGFTVDDENSVVELHSDGNPAAPADTTKSAALASGEPMMTAVPEPENPPSAVPEPQKILLLADHPLLQDPNVGLQNLDCALPPWESTPTAAEDFFTTALDCLDAAWRPLLESYGLPFTSPAVHFPTGSSFDTACGTIDINIATSAYYCENSLYVPFSGLQTEIYGDSPGVYLALLAHEYGHHVQELAGIMDAAWQRIYTAGIHSKAGLEMSRRKELQAQCFSGMFLGSHVDYGTITRDMYDKAWFDQQNRGDQTSGTHDHGSNAHYAEWWRAGARSNHIASCNTFAAAPADVS